MVGGNWLATGVGEEEGWSADMWARFWGGRELQVEYAELRDDLFGMDTGNAHALMARADLWRSYGWGLAGYYSDVEAGFNPIYSTVNPYFEAYGTSDLGLAWLQWERWLNNPLALPNLEVLGGTLDLDFGDTEIAASYYMLDSNGGDARGYGWRNTPWGFFGEADEGEVPYDALASLRVGREVADGVMLNLVYAYQWFNEASGITGPDDSPLDDVDLLMAAVAVGF
jgi:hypothetical protein